MYLFDAPQGVLKCRKILRHGADGFTSHPMEVVLRNFITLKNLSSSAVFEPTNLGSNGKHHNHNTTDNKKYHRTTMKIAQTLEYYSVTNS
jgi:hypothetical protein